MEQIIKELIEETKYELFHYPVTTKKQDIKYIVKRFIKPKDTPKRDSFFWTHAMLTQTLETAGELKMLEKYYDAWIEKGLPIYHVDNIMNGYSLLYVYEKTKDVKYKQAADKLYAWICDYAKEMENPLPYRKHHPTHVYVDGLGMMIPFLCRYGSMFGNQEAIELGVKQITDFLKYGMDEVTGLPYHGYDTKTKVKQGIIGWGRAVGWLMLAMADSIEYLPEGKEKQEITEAFRKLTANVCKYLREDGYFSWQMQALEGPKDTSVAAMIGYAMKKGTLVLGEQQEKLCCMEQEVQDKRVGRQTAHSDEENNEITETIKEIKSALRNSCKNGKIRDCSGECEGFSQYPQVYGAYPWSLGPGLRLFLMK